MRLLLDTHVFLWAAAAPDKISGRMRQAIADRTNDVFVSAASAWEIAVKHGLGRLALPADPWAYVPARLRELSISDLAITREHALRTSALPPIHRDPFDRLLVAQAQTESLTLVTADDLVLQYPVRLVDARR